MQQPAARHQVCARLGSPVPVGPARGVRFRRSLLTAICEQLVGLPPSHDALAGTYARSWEGLGSHLVPLVRLAPHRLLQVTTGAAAACSSRSSRDAEHCRRSRRAAGSSHRSRKSIEQQSVVVFFAARPAFAQQQQQQKPPAAQPHIHACRAFLPCLYHTPWTAPPPICTAPRAPP